MTTGSTIARFTITLSKSVAEPVQVAWNTKDGTAKAGIDYAAASGTAVFSPGATNKNVDVLVYGRAVGTEDRNFFLEMTPPPNAIMGESIGECIIYLDTAGNTAVIQVIVPTGRQGAKGDSAYKSWLNLGNTGTEQDFIDYLSPPVEEIAAEVAPILDISSSPLTAEGTETLSKPDTMTGKRLARRVAYVGAAKVATVVLADGDNLITHADLSGDAVDFNSISLYPRILRGTAVISPKWSVEPGDKILIKSAVAGDVLHVCQYDVISGRAVKNVVEPLVSTALAPVSAAVAKAGSQAFEALRRSYAEYGRNLVDGSFEAGGTLVNVNDVLLHEAGGKAFSGPAGTVAAGTNPASGGFVDVSGVIGRATYTGIRTYTGNDYKISCKGRSAARDGGGGDFYLDLTDTTSADDDGTILVDSLGRRWKREYRGSKRSEWFGVSQSSSDISASMLAAVSTGGRIEIGDGQFNLINTVATDFTSATFPVAGRKSARYEIHGTTMFNTTFNTNGNLGFKHIGNSYTNPETRGQGIYSNSEWSNFCIYGTNYTGTGIEFVGQIYATVKRLLFKKLLVGMRLTGVLVSDTDNLYFQFCERGLVMGVGENSDINSVTLSNMKFGSCYKYAIQGQVGTRVTFAGGDVENCGWGAGDVGGDDSTGGIKLDIMEPLSVITIKDYYFEGNEGLADIIINNATSAPIIVNIKNTVFVRGNRRGRGCKFNIYPTSTGGGLVVLNFSGSYFFTQNNGGYTPISSEPIIFPQPFVRVYGLDTCISSQRVNVAQDLIGGNSSVPMNVSSAGTKMMGPLWLSVVKASTGRYRITSTYTMGVNVNQYSVAVTPVVDGFMATYSRINEISFDVVTRDSTGALADCGFSLLMVTGAGEGR